MVNRSYNAHTEPIFKKINLLKFLDIHLMHLGQFMFSFKNAILPQKFENIFTINNQIHRYNTRHVNSFRLPLCRTNIRQFSVFFQGSKFFNSLSPEISGSSSLGSFKTKLKAYIIDNYKLRLQISLVIIYRNQSSRSFLVREPKLTSPVVFFIRFPRHFVFYSLIILYYIVALYINYYLVY